MKLIIFILFFLYIWSFRLTFFPIRPIILLGIPGFFLLMMKFNTEYMKILSLLSIPVFYSFFISIFYGTYQFDITYMFIAEICRFTGAFALVELVNKNSKLTRQELIISVSKYYIAAVLLQICAGAFFQFFNKDLFFYINYYYIHFPDEISKNKVLYLERFKVLGATNFTSAALLAYTAVLLCVTFIANGIEKINLKNIFCIIFLMLSSCFLGRTVLVSYALAFPYFIKKIKTRYLIIFTGIITLGVLVLITFLPENTLRFAFEPIYALLEGGQVRSDSTDDLMNMWTVKADSFSGWLWGDGNWIESSGVYYKGTDAGYLRSILYWGITGTIIYYTSTLLVLIAMTKKMPYYLRSLFPVFTIVWLVVNLKVFALPIGMFGGILALLYIANQSSSDYSSLIKNTNI